MHLKLKQDISGTSIVEVRIRRDDKIFTTVPHSLLDGLIQFKDAEEIDAIVHIGYISKERKHFWLSRNIDYKVYLSKEEPIRTLNGFNYGDVYTQVPDDFLDCGTRVSLARMELPLVFVYKNI